MAKQLSISIPDKMHAELKVLKEELRGKHGKRKISKVCQKAIMILLTEARVSKLYRDRGNNDGRALATTLTDDDKRHIAKILGNTGSYKKWSKFEKIETLKDHFTDVRKIDIRTLFPKFIQIMDGEYDIHAWVNEDEKLAEDKRGELAWSYCEGIFEGINEAYIDESQLSIPQH